jgi:hypothetical protein
MHVRSADPIAVLVKEVQLKHGISKYFIMQRHGAQAAGRRRERKARGRRAGAHEVARCAGLGTLECARSHEFECHTTPRRPLRREDFGREECNTQSE